MFGSRLRILKLALWVVLVGPAAFGRPEKDTSARAVTTAKGAAAPTRTPRPVLCPRVPKKAGVSCTAQGECTYVDCGGKGRITVRCNGSHISVEILPCTPTWCGGLGGPECEGDKICVERSSGHHDARCVANPCGKNALTCDCAAPLCEGDPCAVNGTTVHCGDACKTCP